MALGDISLTAVGRLTTDPELKFLPDGTAKCEFTIAVNPRARDQSGQWQELDASFVPVTCWRQLAENCAETLRKGVPVIVHGIWREERWEDERGKHARWRLTAHAVGPHLAYMTATLTKTNRPRPSAPAETNHTNGGTQ